MNDKQKQLMSHVQLYLSDLDEITEEVLENAVNTFTALFAITDEEKEEVKRELQTRFEIKMDRGAVIKDKKHVPWYNSAKKDMPTTFQDRYRTYLLKDKGFTDKVLDRLDETTDEIMDLIGNPKAGNYLYKGLVIGDVQSGKTSTYISLINKAADAGYSVIILLTGTIEKLREQTQERLDYGFIGLDSRAFMEDNQNNEVGVGRIDPSGVAIAFTSTKNDFSLESSRQMIGRLSGFNAPILFVLKKNKNVLENLERWLKNSAESGVIRNRPMLLIDDEADNASVNTKKTDDDPSTINRCIRNLLDLFSQASYVAFTATPYANIFINPDSDESMEKADLFPSNFIYALEAPSNYIGATKIFDEDGKYRFMLKTNDDCEEFVPEKHNKEFVVGKLPLSLKEAIASFFIGNAIRDLRGQEKEHRTMLINISRFIQVQNSIQEEVSSYIKAVQREVRNYCHTNNALDHGHIKFIYDTYQKHFATLTDFNLDGEKRFTWKEILDVLDSAISPINARAINGGNAKSLLNYDDYKETGLRLIAIGGFSLSRGLTLEGLMVSYFYRNSKMYDTLMQMGRWFGYRDHYADTCQIWMGENSQDWYEYISMATEDLKNDVRKMMNINATPVEFGLGVRSDINALIVTAVNKMRSAFRDIPMNVSLSGKVVETRFMFTSTEKNERNYKAIIQWIDELYAQGYKAFCYEKLALSKHLQVLDVKKELIIDLLKNYESHPFNYYFVTEDIINSINNCKDDTLDKWDVVIASGSSDYVENLGHDIEINPVKRSFRFLKDGIDSIQMSGSKSRIGSTNYAKGGLTKQRVEEIETEVRNNRAESDKKKAFTENDYFNHSYRKPLLVIYPVQLRTETMNENPEDEQRKEELTNSLHHSVMGLAVGIPRTRDNENIVYKYTINRVKWKEIIGINDDFLEETGEDDVDD